MSVSKRLAVAVVTLLAIVGSPVCAQVLDQVNVYFDANASVYELPDATYPSLISGFLVLDHPSDPDGTRGWELKLSSDPNLTLISGEVLGENINVSNFPEFMVGYADTIAPAGDKIVLATFSIFATGPGCIYISENTHSGYPAIQTPVYLPCADMNSPRALGVRQDLYGGASATIGATPLVPSSFFGPVDSSEECSNFDAEPKTQLYGFTNSHESWGVEAADAGYIFVTDPGANKVVRYGLYGANPVVIDLPQHYTEPRWLAVDDERDWLYVRTQGRPAVLVYDFSGTFVDSIGGYPYGETVGQFRANSLGPIALDADGNLYVVDNNRIQSFTTANGWSAALVVTSGTNPAAPNFWIAAKSLAVDTLNRLYLLDGGYYPQVPALVHVYQGATCIGAWGRNGNSADTFQFPWTVRVSDANKVYVSCKVSIPGSGADTYGMSVHGMDGSPVDAWSLDGTRPILGFDFVSGVPNFLAAGFHDYSAQESTIRVYGREMAAVDVMSARYQDAGYNLTSDAEVLAECYDTGDAMRGVVADSVTALLLVQDWPAPLNGQLSVRDPALPSSLRGVGALESIDGVAHGTTLSFSTQNIGERDVLLLYYHSPMDFVRANVAPDLQKVARDVSFDVAASGSLASASETFSRALAIERVPVAFVHGFLGGPTQFRGFLGIRDDPKWIRDINRFDIDYWATSGDSLAINSRLVDSHVQDFLSNTKNRGVAASQIDFIAHSMGGVILRYIASTSDASPGEVPYAFRGYDNRGKGYCHKVLFCNTPHKGTPLARDVSDMMDYVMFGPNTREGMIARAGMLCFMQSALVLDATPTSAKKAFGAAIRQLRDDSPEIASLASFDVPSFGIVGTGGSDLTSGIYQMGMWGLGRMWSTFTEQPGMVELHSQEHDGVVPRYSQQAGMQDGSYYLARDLDGFHESVFREPPVLSLLVSGFTRGVVTAWNARAAHSDSMQQSVEANNGAKASGGFGRSKSASAVTWFPDNAGEVIAVSVLNALGHEGPLTPGQTYTVRVVDVYGTGLGQAYVAIDGEFLELSPPDFQAAYKVPPDVYQNVTFRGVALTTSGQIAFAAPNVRPVDMTGKNLASISVEDSAIGIVGPGDVRQLRVWGHFSDGIDRLIPGSLVAFGGWDPAVVNVTSGGAVIGISAGTTEVTATLGSFQGQVTVHVRTGNRVFNTPVADAGSRYTYCGNREVCLDASASYDYDQALGEVLQFAWDLDGDGEFDNASGPTACWTYGDGGAERVVGLKVTDSTGRAGYDYALLLPVSAMCEDAHLVCAFDTGTCGTRGIACAPTGGTIFIDHSGAPTEILMKRFDTQCASDVNFSVADSRLGTDVAVTPSGVVCFISGKSIVRYDSSGQSMAPISMPNDRNSYETQLEVDGLGRFYVAAHGHGSAVYIDRLSATGARQVSWRVIDDTYATHTVSISGDVFVAIEGEDIVKVHEQAGTLVVDTSWASAGHLVPDFGGMIRAGNMAASAGGELYKATLSSGEWTIARYDEMGVFKDAKSGHSGRAFNELWAIDVNENGHVAAAEGDYEGACEVSIVRFDGSASAVADDDPGSGASGDIDSRVWLRAPAVVSSGRVVSLVFHGGRQVEANLGVYDLRGMLVNTLFDGPIGGNEQQVSWHQDDRHGARVAAGMYILRLSVGAEVLTKKVVIVR